jgi:hypothetical protein
MDDSPTGMPPAPKLAAQFHDRRFWTQLMPELPIGEIADYGDVDAWAIAPAEAAMLPPRLDREGYLHLPGLQEPETAARLGRAVHRLASLGIPPVFCLVYDAFWIPAGRLSALLKIAFGANYVMLPAFWVWHVDPAKSESGWPPHREVGRRALFADGRPKALSAWLALSDATPMNGCMYVVPADRDPTYGTEREMEFTFDLPDVRALPAASGDVFIWNQALLHWGAHASPRAGSPRMSLAFEFMHEDAEPFGQSILSPLVVPSFDERLTLIAKQVSQYTHMTGLNPQLETLARSL